MWWRWRCHNWSGKHVPDLHLPASGGLRYLWPLSLLHNPSHEEEPVPAIFTATLEIAVSRFQIGPHSPIHQSNKPRSFSFSLDMFCRHESVLLAQMDPLLFFFMHVLNVRAPNWMNFSWVALPVTSKEDSEFFGLGSSSSKFSVVYCTICSQQEHAVCLFSLTAPVTSQPYPASLSASHFPVCTG